MISFGGSGCHDIKDVGKAIQEVFCQIEDCTYQPGRFCKWAGDRAVDVVFDASDGIAAKYH
jgi:hypothetical protein